MQQNQRENLMFWGLFEQDWPVFNKVNKPLVYKSRGGIYTCKTALANQMPAVIPPARGAETGRF